MRGRGGRRAGRGEGRGRGEGVGRAGGALCWIEGGECAWGDESGERASRSLESTRGDVD